MADLTHVMTRRAGRELGRRCHVAAAHLAMYTICCHCDDMPTAPSNEAPAKLVCLSALALVKSARSHVESRRLLPCTLICHAHRRN